ncbi:MAG: hypothetical protein AMXMBFR36_22330 [Acidobacteriota bacterium]
MAWILPDGKVAKRAAFYGMAPIRRNEPLRPLHPVRRSRPASKLPKNDLF